MALVYYPPEWQRQKAIWLTFPHNDGQWSTRLVEIQDFYLRWLDVILDFQDANLIFLNENLLNSVKNKLAFLDNKKYKLNKLIFPNDDIWIRDYGPFFVKKNERNSIIDCQFNAWGGKFPPWDKDNALPKLLSEKFSYPYKSYDLVLEGGSLEFNGAGIALTTEQCLLNKNRNPHLNKSEIENQLKSIFNLEKILWLKRGLEGDHTDGHIDDFARFISPDKLILCRTEDQANPNYDHLEESFDFLNSTEFKTISIPLAKPLYRDGEMLPCSYANFIFLNDALVVPIFSDELDKLALDQLTQVLPDRKIIGLDSRVLIYEGGALHCASKQEPQ